MLSFIHLTGHTSKQFLSNRQQLPSGKQLEFRLLLHKVIKKYCLEYSLGGGGGVIPGPRTIMSATIAVCLRRFLTRS